MHVEIHKLWNYNNLTRYQRAVSPWTVQAWPVSPAKMNAKHLIALSLCKLFSGHKYKVDTNIHVDLMIQSGILKIIFLIPIEVHTNWKLCKSYFNTDVIRAKIGPLTGFSWCRDFDKNICFGENRAIFNKNDNFNLTLIGVPFWSINGHFM